MKTVFLRIDDDPAGGYRLWLDEDQPAAGTVGPVPLPADLSVGGKPLDTTAALNLVLTNRNATDDFQKLGAHLHGLLRGTQVETQLKSLQRSNEKMRLLLDVRATIPVSNSPVKVSSLPWELLHDDPAWWWIDSKTPMTRVREDLWRAEEPAPCPWPLRVLVVVGLNSADPVGDPEGEVRKIQRAARPNNHPRKKREWLTALDVEVLRRPEDPAQLVKRYEEFKPHILHFIGHGDVPQGGRPRLRFDLSLTPPRKLWGWSDQDISTYLANVDWRPRFVFLNACRSGAGVVGDAKTSRSLADIFLARGVPAVLAMQGDIRGPQAETLAETLYLRLAAGDPLDVALTAARYLVGSMEPDGLRRRDWALPVLTLTCLPHHALPMLPRLRPPDDEPVEQCPDFAIVSTLVNQQVERRSVYRAFHPAPRPDSDPVKHQLVVVGPNGAGKTSLARACMEAALRQGHRVCWVNLARTRASGLQRTTLNWLDLLRLICSGDWDEENGPPPVHREPLPAAEFHRFFWELNHRLDDGSDPPWDNSPAVDRGLPLVAKVNDLDKKTFATFRSCLQAAAQRTPLYLVFDDFGGGPPALAPDDFKRIVKPLLFDGIARGERGGFGRVYLMLLLTQEECSSYGLVPDVQLEFQPADTFVDLAYEFFEYKHFESRGKELPDRVKNVIRDEWELAQNLAPWSPSELERYYAEKQKRWAWL